MLSAPSRVCFPPLLPPQYTQPTTSGEHVALFWVWLLVAAGRRGLGLARRQGGRGRLPHACSVPGAHAPPSQDVLTIRAPSPVSHRDPACLCPFPSGEPQGHLGTQGGSMGTTHVIEHFVELLGVHDEVGVAYHVVDCVCLDGETEGSEGPAVVCGRAARVRAKPLPPQGFLMYFWKDFSLV